MACRVNPTWSGSVTATICITLGVEQALHPLPDRGLGQADRLARSRRTTAAVLLELLDDRLATRRRARSAALVAGALRSLADRDRSRRRASARRSVASSPGLLNPSRFRSIRCRRELLGPYACRRARTVTHHDSVSEPRRACATSSAASTSTATDGDRPTSSTRHRPGVRHRPGLGAADVDAAYAAGRRGLRDVAGHHAERAPAGAAEVRRRRSRRAPTSSIALEAENTGKPHALTASEEIPPMVDQIRFFAGAARVLEGRRPASTWPATRRSSAASRSASSAR